MIHVGLGRTTHKPMMGWVGYEVEDMPFRSVPLPSMLVAYNMNDLRGVFMGTVFGGSTSNV